MGLLDKIKVMVGPLVFKKNGEPSCGFGSYTKASAILDTYNWGILADGVESLEQELSDLRAELADKTEEAKAYANQLKRNAAEYNLLKVSRDSHKAEAAKYATQAGEYKRQRDASQARVAALEGALGEAIAHLERTGTNIKDVVRIQELRKALAAVKENEE